jgi:hypothetical protein
MSGVKFSVHTHRAAAAGRFELPQDNIVDLRGATFEQACHHSAQPISPNSCSGSSVDNLLRLAEMRYVAIEKVRRPVQHGFRRPLLSTWYLKAIPAQPTLSIIGAIENCLLVSVI